MTVFQRNRIPRQMLPDPCFRVFIVQCTQGNNINIYLSSTSEWYTLISDKSIVYTLGIVYANVNSLSVPVSVRGLEVVFGETNFQINHGVKYGIDEGSIIITDETQQSCKPFELMRGDIFQFLEADSFMKTLLHLINPALPNWLRFEKVSDEKLAAQDVRTEFVKGEDMDDVSSCSGAPVIPDHLYTVFRFGTGFKLRVMEQNVTLPKPIVGKKFCLIIDLCQSYGGTIFLITPEESRELLEDLYVFKNLKEEQNLHIQPIGIGVSLTNGIYARYHHLSLQLWNGDKMFKPLLPEVDLWIRGDVTFDDKSLSIAGKADIYVGVPSVQTMLTSWFREEWTLLVDMTFSKSPILRFELFGKKCSISFSNLITGALNIYISFGGSDRVWCGDVSNPSGAFISAFFDTNPFAGVPILEDWHIYNTYRVYAYIRDEPVEIQSSDSETLFNDDIFEIETYLKNIIDTIDGNLDVIETEFLNSTQLLIQELRDITVALQGLIDKDLLGNLNDKIVLLNRIRELYLQLQQVVSNLNDVTEFIPSLATKNIAASIILQMNSIKTKLETVFEKVSDYVKKYELKKFSFKFYADLNINRLAMVGLEIELFLSEKHLFQCSRFDQIRSLLEGEESIRFIGRALIGSRLGYFLSINVGFGVGGAFSKNVKKYIIQQQVFINMIGIRQTADIFITNRGLQFYFEGNVWDIFLAEINVSSAVDIEWSRLAFNLQGRFVANDRKKRDKETHVSSNIESLNAFRNAKRSRRTHFIERGTYSQFMSRKRREVQRVSSSFQSSFKDALKNVISLIGEETNSRLSQMQAALTVAQNGLNRAQNWLEDKKESLRQANKYFDNAIIELEKAKQMFERAKAPYNKAIKKLKDAEKDVEKLCRIRTCPTICIPGIRCNWCYWRGPWGSKVGYPCCDWDGCMISFPEPSCVIYNTACRAVRAVAFAALDTAIFAVKSALLPYDLAQGALTGAQFIVDKARVAIKVAEGFLESAKLGFEFAKTSLDAAKSGLEAVKKVVGAGFQLLGYIINDGINNIVDVRNCGFEIELSTKDLPVFDVICEVNAFRLGWRKIIISINFKNILQSVWQAARATINAFMETFDGGLIGRKKRDDSFETISKMHGMLRKMRDAEFSNETEIQWNETINIREDILGFSGDNISESENRIQIFKEKCKSFQTVHKFMNEAFSMIDRLLTMSKSDLDKINQVNENIQGLNNTESLIENITVDSSGISREYASKDYNLTEDDLEQVITNAKATAADDPLMKEIKRLANDSLEQVDAERRAVESIDFLNVWFTSMKNMTSEFFNESECEDFKDCIFYSISRLYGLYEYETIGNITQIRDTIMDLEEILIELLQNESSTISAATDAIRNVNEHIAQLADKNLFCSGPPMFVTQPTNLSVFVGNDATFYCEAKGDPEPAYHWFVNGTSVEGNAKYFILTNTSEKYNNTSFYCTAENLVTTVTSDVVYLIVAPLDYKETDECAVDNGSCGQICNNTIGSFQCSCFPGYTLMTDGLNCKDINECLGKDGGCEQLCTNEEGTFKCSCKDGFLLDADGHSCTDINECMKENGGCLYKCENEVGTFKCVCNDGFIFQENSTTCQDENECELDNGGCAHICVNEIGSYKCECKHGFALEEDGLSCKDIDECINNNGGCAHRCQNENGSFKCQCIKGFQLQDDGVSCVDINECQSNEDGCEHKCVNEVGSYICDCPDGYKLKDDDKSCEDINECEDRLDNCSLSCMNFKGTYTCSCPAGFSLMDDAITCQKLVQQKLSSLIRLAISPELKEENLEELAMYISITGKVKEALTDHMNKYTDANIIVIVNNIRIGSIIADYTIVINHSPATTKAIDDLFDAIMDLSYNGSILYDGTIIQAETLLPENVTDHCDIFQSIQGSCEVGYRCDVVENRPTCQFVQGNAEHDNIIVYIAPPLGVAGLIGIILLIVCVVRNRRIKKKRKIHRSTKTPIITEHCADTKDVQTISWNNQQVVASEPTMDQE